MSYYPKISVIVPVYNTEPYLRRCLDSLVNQTLKDIEIICINDCSTDSSLSILREYTAKYNRLKVINFEKNQGVSVARNAGMEIAKGEYIGFVDSDDHVDFDFYKKLYEKALDSGLTTDMIRGEVKFKKFSHKYYSIHKIGKHFALDKLNLLDTFWCYIYKTSFLRKNKIYFPPGIKLSQDLVFIVKSVIFSNKIDIIYHNYYYYCEKRPGSSSISIGKEILFSYGIPLVLDFINRRVKNKNYYYNYYGFYFNALFFHYSITQKKYRKEFAKNIVKYYKQRKYPICLEHIPKTVNVSDLNDAHGLCEKLELWRKRNLRGYPNIKINMLSDRKLYIWGVGQDSTNALNQCEQNGWKISAFLDSNKDIKEFNGYKVKLPEQILNKAKRDFFIIISSRAYGKEMAKICKHYGLKRGIDFWKPC